MDRSELYIRHENHLPVDGLELLRRLLHVRGRLGQERLVPAGHEVGVQADDK